MARNKRINAFREAQQSTRTQKLAARIGASEYADGSYFTTRDWFNGKNYGEALLGQAVAARGNGRPKIAKAYERMARNNGATADDFKNYRGNLKAAGLSVG